MSIENKTNDVKCFNLDSSYSFYFLSGYVIHLFQNATEKITLLLDKGTLYCFSNIDYLRES